MAKETRDGEARVALVPELVGKLTGLGYEVVVEPDAGRSALHDDDEYVQAGAVIADDALATSDVVVSVQPLDPGQVRRLKAGAATLSFLPVNQEHALVADLRDTGVTAFALELVPRISRAQSMDALSSQALVSGYRCAVVAAGLLRRFFPQNMTAAGTIQPAKVVVLGAGVAGLQAIATAKRLGAVVSAYDVRAAAAEEIRSMGAKAIELDLETLEGAGGYAREMTEDRAARQRDLLAPHIAAADALITTAAVPGRQAPLLVTAAMVEQMPPGLRRRRPGRRVRRQRRGIGGRRGGADRRRAGVGRPQRALADARAGVAALRPEHRQPADPDDRHRRGRHRPLRAGLRRRDRRRRLRHPRGRDPAPAHPRGPRGTRPGGRGGPAVNEIAWLTVFVLSVFVGIEVISKVSSTLHTPLMSGANAIHGVILLGAIIVTAHADGVALVVGLIAIVLATVNMVGGFVVTDRMLQMFTRRARHARPPRAVAPRQDEAAA